MLEIHPVGTLMRGFADYRLVEVVEIFEIRCVILHVINSPSQKFDNTK